MSSGTTLTDTAPDKHKINYSTNSITAVTCTKDKSMPQNTYTNYYNTLITKFSD